MKIRTRFAPSPTGQLHIGSIRTALYAWLFAKQQGGKFVLRIDDSDIRRSTQKNVKEIIQIMCWLNLDWDEGPYFQSERSSRYNSVIDKMLIEGKAYKCFCSRKRLEHLRQVQLRNNIKPRYDGRCRYSSLNYQSCIKNKSYVVRFCNPCDGEVKFYDEIKGWITFSNQELDDLIICRDDGSPTYNFCVVIDDIDMNITHVVRGNDHVNNTPRQINIFKSLNVLPPKYAHLPMVLDEFGKKFSKRSENLGIVKYQKDGFLPEAILNYLVRLGWSRGDQEIFNVEEMKRCFNFNSISRSPGFFDINKLVWLNHYYINNLPVTSIADYLENYMKQQNLNVKNGPPLIDIVKVFGPRCKTLKDIIDSSFFCYKDFDIFKNTLSRKYLQPEVIEPLFIIRKKLTSLKIWSMNKIHDLILEVVTELSIQTNKLGMPLRIALTGLDKSPNLADIVYLIGKERSLKRIDTALYYISKL
ncbi:glutamate--tRNA ligase [Blochmannia endosymbiont of Colobopsis nipponica]|uniref:glutamate--tRNA ligase n=1 Tax=Blochmannia endosymbiont of Colobopsis nipponica TaxID=2681987 RepID=UPI00178002BD|nr:glutamate--tRNA ligase [Blochmannia endosymbiont of Colobopsis nipponica]QOI10963.1 glutamate--tRNA ligase [Blochmannia endosymbiont of Colobopsis nipponica]